MARGNGAYVLHKSIERHLSNFRYKVCGYSPWLTLLPITLPLAVELSNADLIHTVPDYGLFFYSKKTPMVTTVHHYMCDGEMKPYSSFLQNIHYRTDLKWFIKKSIALSKEVTAVSNYTAEHIRNKLKLKRRIHVIPNGIDESFFIPPAQKRQASKIRVLFSGNLSRRKGSHWLPAISKRLNPNIIIQHTTGLRNEKLHNSGGNILNLGRIPFKDLPKLYHNHDILISPTVREGFGLAIAEAMACGLPVVASNCSAVPELIDDGKGGFLCPIGDTDFFAQKINTIAESPSLRREMGEYNRAKVEKMFTIKKMINGYRELFEKILS